MHRAVRTTRAQHPPSRVHGYSRHSACVAAQDVAAHSRDGVPHARGGVRGGGAERARVGAQHQTSGGNGLCVALQQSLLLDWCEFCISVVPIV